MEDTLRKKKNIGKRLIVLNIVLLLLAVTVFAAIKLSPGKTGKEEIAGVDDTKVVSTDTTPTPTTTSEAEKEEVKISTDETKSRIELNGQSYAFNQIPEMSLGVKFKIFGGTEPLAEVEVTVQSNTVTYSTKANSTGEWQVEVATDTVGEGDHSFQTRITPPGEINGVTFDAVSFRVKAQAVETIADGEKDIVAILTSLPVLLSVIGFAIIVCLVAAFLLIRKKKVKSVNVDTKINSPEPEKNLNPESDLKISGASEDSQKEVIKKVETPEGKLTPETETVETPLGIPVVGPTAPGTEPQPNPAKITVEEKENDKSVQK